MCNQEHRGDGRFPGSHPQTQHTQSTAHERQEGGCGARRARTHLGSAGPRSSQHSTISSASSETCPPSRRSYFRNAPRNQPVFVTMRKAWSSAAGVAFRVVNFVTNRWSQGFPASQDRPEHNTQTQKARHRSGAHHVQAFSQAGGGSCEESLAVTGPPWKLLAVFLRSQRAGQGLF
jgi:hypothetical protein